MRDTNFFLNGNNIFIFFFFLIGIIIYLSKAYHVHKGYTESKRPPLKRQQKQKEPKNFWHPVDSIFYFFYL